MEVFRYFGTLFLKDEASKGLDRVEKQGQKLQKGFDRVGAATTKAGKTMSKYVTGPLAALGTATVGLVTKTANHADRLLDLADITGMSTDTIQEWQYVAGQAGVSTEFATRALERMTKRLPNIAKGSGPAAEAIEAMGINLDDFLAMSNEERFDLLVNKLAAIEDESDRNAKASAIFGRAWEDLAPVLGMGADEIENLRGEAHELGVVIGNEALQEANKYRQEMEKVKTALMGAAFEIGSKLAPILTTHLIPAVQEATPLFVKLVEKVADLVEWFVNLSPETQRFIGIAGGLAAVLGPTLIFIGKVATGISALIPVITKLTGVLRIVTIAKAALNMTMLASPITWIILGITALIAIGVLLYKNWDMIKEKLAAAWDMIKEKAGAVWDWIKEKIGAVWEGIKAAIQSAVELVWNWIKSSWDKILSTTSSVFERIKSIVKTIWNAIKTTVTNLVKSMVDWVVTRWNNLRNRVSNTIENLRSRMSTAWARIKDRVIDMAKQTVDRAVQFFKDLPGKIMKFISSLPGKLAKKAKDIASSFWNGFKKGLGISSPSYVEYAFMDMSKAADDALESMAKTTRKIDNLITAPNAQAFHAATTPPVPAFAGASGGGGGGNITMNFNFNGPPPRSQNELREITKAAQLGLARAQRIQQMVRGRRTTR